MKERRLRPSPFILVLAAIGVLMAGAATTLSGVCGPFTDVGDDAFCPFLQEIFYLGITSGTSPTTYAPDEPVTRIQAAAFLSRTVDAALRMGSRRAAIGQFWTPRVQAALGQTEIGSGIYSVVSDGTDLWVSRLPDSVVRVRGSDGRVLETWTGVIGATQMLAAMGKIFVIGTNQPYGTHVLYRLDPSQPAGSATVVATELGDIPQSIAFDGTRIWTGNTNASISAILPTPTPPWRVTNLRFGFWSPTAVVFDGASLWAVDYAAKTLLRLEGGGILQTVTLGGLPELPIFDGASLWVPNQTFNAVSVVRASTGAILATLTAEGLFSPRSAAFDGERVMVTSSSRVCLWKASSLSPLGCYPFGAGAACSDGINFWLTMGTSLARF